MECGLVYVLEHWKHMHVEGQTGEVVHIVTVIKTTEHL